MQIQGTQGKKLRPLGKLRLALQRRQRLSSDWRVSGSFWAVRPAGADTTGEWCILRRQEGVGLDWPVSPCS